MSFTYLNLQSSLFAMPAGQQLVLALSGGVDSVVLLHALTRLRDTSQLSQSLSAIHVNHGLHADAPQWQALCEELCSQWQVPLQCEQVSVSCQGSLENAARESRYACFEGSLSAGDVLLLAHHLDDQLETMLLRLLRGAGPAGLAAMPQQRSVGKGMLYRPLLEFSRSDLLDYARREQLRWIEDSSNADRQHDRNFLRQLVLPAIEQRWPNYRESWSKSLVLQGEAAQMLGDLAQRELPSVQTREGQLKVSSLAALPASHRRNVLRYWLQQLGLQDPGWHVLHQLLEETLEQQDGSGKLDLPGCRLQVFNDRLYALRHPTQEQATMNLDIDLSQQNELSLAENGRLQIAGGVGAGIASRFTKLQVRSRSGGENLRLPGRPKKALKKLFQESSIPPWLRQRTPLLYANEQLVCVPGIGVAEQAVAGPDEPSFAVHWLAPDMELTSQ